jgi:hypothetical protein
MELVSRQSRLEPAGCLQGLRQSAHITTVTKLIGQDFGVPRKNLSALCTGQHTIRAQQGARSIYRLDTFYHACDLVPLPCVSLFALRLVMLALMVGTISSIGC